ncbi:PP2C family protein-serine/threonine phosphatase [Puerhibacterium puerhi]|uniref:PP2C family protein-serine/threonine phosphatase n=1 Tax=Puerhibacterium puerhi TaxID=2692623 RepID=UPI00135A9914|nr:SpoIIE family protein phosphatase [Puerhibacterium puerhi]
MTLSATPEPGHAPFSVETARDLARRALEAFDRAQPEELRPTAVRHVRTLLDALVDQTRAVQRAAESVAERQAGSRRQERVLAHLAADSRDETVPLGIAITRSGWTRRLVSADGAIVRAEDRVTFVGEVPDDEEARLALMDFVADAGDEVVHTDDLPVDAPGVAAKAPGVRSVMGIALPERQVLLWLRSPNPDGTTAPWTSDQVDSAAALRGHLVEALYLRGRKEVRATGELQRSLLPTRLPRVEGWTIEARYEAAGSGLVGGDWYDALRLPSGSLALVVGDVTGHGLQAAATMGQLRTALRTGLVTTGSARDAVAALCETARWTLPGEVATVSVALLDTVTGELEHVSLGHPPLLVVGPDGTPVWGPRAGVPPLGLTRAVPEPERLTVPDGGALVLFSDGLVERRGESIMVGLGRLERSFTLGPRTDVDTVVRGSRDQESADDATLLVARRGV